MGYPTRTYTFSNSTTADATQVNQNFTDFENGFSDGTKDLNMNQGAFAGKLTASAAFVTSGVSTVVATNGGSSTVADTTSVVILAPAGTIASYTLTLPSNPSEGQRLTIVTNGNEITALTLSANTGHTLATGTSMTTLVAGMSMELIFRSTVWYRAAGVLADGTSIAYSGGILGVPNGGISRAKIESVGQQISSGCAGFSTSSSSFVDVTNLSVTITTSGRPVVVGLIHDGDSTLGNEGFVGAFRLSNTLHGYFRLLRDATVLAIFRIEIIESGSATTLLNQKIPCGTINHLDVVTAGTYTYKLQASNLGVDASTVQVNYSKLFAFEL